MDREFLKSLGLDDAAIDKIMAAYGKAVQGAQSETQALKAKLEAANKTAEEAAAAAKQFEGIDVDGLKQSAAEWEKKAKTFERTASEREKQISQMEYDADLTAALVAARSRNTVAVRALLDESKLKRGEKGIEGLEEQLEALKKTSGYMFEPEPSGGAGFDGKQPPGSSASAPQTLEDAVRMNYEQQMKGGS